MARTNQFKSHSPFNNGLSVVGSLHKIPEIMHPFCREQAVDRLRGLELARREGLLQIRG